MWAVSFVESNRSWIEPNLSSCAGVDNWNEVEEQRDMLVVVVDLIQGTSEEVETFTREGAAKPAHTFKHVGKYFASKREIVVHGGRPDLFEDIYSSQLFALEVDRMTWRQLSYHGKPPLQQSSHMGCVNPKGDRMFVFASYEVEPQRSELYLFDYTGRIPMWTLIETQGSVLPGYYGGCMDMVDSGQIVIYGGLVDGNSCDELLTYNISSSTWKEGKPTPTAVREFEFNVDGEVPAKRVRHASIVWNGTIIYFGGECTVGEPLDDLMVLEL